MATITKRKNGWSAQVRRKGYATRTKTIPTKGAATAWAREQEGLIDQGRLPVTERAGVLVRVHSGPTSLTAPLNQGLVNDLSKGLAEGRFAFATLEAVALFVMGSSLLALVQLVRAPTPSLAASLAQQICALLLRGLGVPATEADLVAAQASDEIVRVGAYAGAFDLPVGRSH
jgi:hypothetical protein